MNTQNQARNLMMRHSLNVRNRQQSMLGRTASEIGLDLDTSHYESEQSGTLGSTFDRSNAAMS
ncbi:hypothetical protein VB712_09870 [Spirulina sp. CCNP1310]|uniref:hypothetical protein n=1 Tax=Spirulina sp. CCNP1310 TaxID=3110249 RepID=UPI002B205446|nr:hypothetical protein [Spirulina sp. CCNP1310]MEA5419531.1 hypothetical protein [Spirulina sp. CCNP1310]